MSRAHTYLDHAASTPVRPEVLDAMLPYLGGTFGNPSSEHWHGRAARAGLEQARREVAQARGVTPAEVYFTSGGTEADNLAILGRAEAVRATATTPVVAVAATEHKAVLAAAHAVAAHGGAERLLPVD
ncbi:MAG: aminotransferase class V-fold PLP-dependent enzyme, partial [Gemmatimonadota bacterium]|nr:aminotransferase class V-fold PLP-dependent enzyme [Gemmatimonadota bacterium]